jgi:hypothetical protein
MSTMPFSRSRPLPVLLSLLFLAAGACTTDIEIQTVEQTRHPLEGRWHLETVQIANSCPDVDLFGPVDSRAVTLQHDAPFWTLRGGGAEQQVVEVAPQRWEGHVEAPYDGCTLEADTTWEIEVVGPTSFAGRRIVSFRVQGDACGIAEAPCTVTHAVRGVR